MTNPNSVLHERIDGKPISEIPLAYGRWLRWHLPLQLAFILLSLALLVWPVLSGWS